MLIKKVKSETDLFIASLSSYKIVDTYVLLVLICNFNVLLVIYSVHNMYTTLNKLHNSNCRLYFHNMYKPSAFTQFSVFKIRGRYTNLHILPNWMLMTDKQC